jgi:hypothetical protein
MTSSDARGATLARCQAALGRPPPISVAVRIAKEIAFALHAALEARGAVHGDVSPANVVLGYDGTVTLVGFGGTASSHPAYASPELLAGHAADARSDVFSAGVVLFELLTGERPFEGETADAVRAALAAEPVADVRTRNPMLPDAVANVVAGAVERDPSGRFATADAMRHALEVARAAAGIADAKAEDLALWLNQVLPKAARPAGEEPARPSGAHLASPPVAVPDLALPGSEVRPAVPALDLPASRPAPPRAPAPSSPGLDDLDMQIERNLDPNTLPPAISSRTSISGMRAPPVSSGLDLAASRRDLRPRTYEPEAPSIGARVLGWAVSLVVLGGTTAGLVRFAHRAGGRDVVALLPRAFDGTSAAHSGAVSLVALATAVALGFVGVKLTPRSWSLVGCATALLLLALAMVTVTLGSTGESHAPPDGVLLVPYLVPAALAMLGLAFGGRSAVSFTDDRVSRKLAAIPVAALAGFVLFLAYETSKLAAR